MPIIGCRVEGPMCTYQCFFVLSWVRSRDGLQWGAGVLISLVPKSVCLPHFLQQEWQIILYPLSHFPTLPSYNFCPSLPPLLSSFLHSSSRCLLSSLPSFLLHFLLLHSLCSFHISFLYFPFIPCSFIRSFDLLFFLLILPPFFPSFFSLQSLHPTLFSTSFFSY